MGAYDILGTKLHYFKCECSYMVLPMTDNQKWTPCDKPKLGDTLRWNEPLWAEPNKPRGKRDQIGEQQITAELITRSNVLTLKVSHVEKTSNDDAPLKVKIDDIIKRKKTSLEKGDCQQLLS
jgi:hypothetical protein